MNKFEYEYKELLLNVFYEGVLKPNRTGVNAISLFNKSLTIDLKLGFPILTSRKIFFEKAYHEYKWIREGMTSTEYLNKHNIKWWNSYADLNGNLNKTYGHQLRNFNNEIDQLEYAIKAINNKSRQGHVTFWNPSDIKDLSLPACFTGMTPVVHGRELNLSVQFRSSDLMLGLPYDIIMFSLFLVELAEKTNLKPRFLGLQLADAHIYVNHIDQLDEYINNKMFKLPKLIKEDNESFSLKNYEHCPHIKMELNK